MEITFNDERRDEVVTCFVLCFPLNSLQPGARRAQGPGAAEEDCPEPAGSPRGENVIESPVQKRGALLEGSSVGVGRLVPGPPRLKGKEALYVFLKMTLVFL